MLRFAVLAMLVLVPAAVSAETVEKTIPANKPAALAALFALESQGCTAYRVRDTKVTTPPAHGAAVFVDHAEKLPKEFAQCTGKVVNVRWVVYKPAANYRGTDSFSVSYTLPNNTGEQFQTYITSSFSLTVK